MRLVTLLLLAGSLFGLDVTKYMSATIVTVNNSTTTQIRCPLEGAQMIQVYIRPTSTAQAYTITLNDGSTVEVASGGYFTMQVPDKLTVNQSLFLVKTASGSAALQVLAIRNVR